MLLGDVSIAFEMFSELQDKNKLAAIFAEYAHSGFGEEYYLLFVNTFMSAVVVFVLFNAIIYFFYVLGKKFCYNYTKIMANFGLLMVLIISYKYSKQLELMAFLYLFEAIVYAFIILGFRYFTYKESKNEEL